jgi:hypothetical protein
MEMKEAIESATKIIAHFNSIRLLFKADSCSEIFDDVDTYQNEHVNILGHEVEIGNDTDSGSFVIHIYTENYEDLTGELIKVFGQPHISSCNINSWAISHRSTIISTRLRVMIYENYLCK